MKMKTVTYKEYMEDLQKFIQKHSKKYDHKVYTSAFVDNQYHKTYTFEDGSQFTEINEMDVVEKVEVSAHGLTFTVDVHYIRHEYWSTDDSVSKYWFEHK